MKTLSCSKSVETARVNLS